MGKIKIIKFSSSWCKPCEQLKKVFEEILPAYDTDVEFEDIDIEENTEAATEYMIMALPTVVIKVGAKTVERFVGLKSGSEIKAMIDGYVKKV